ncbi:hypothetical protein [Sphingomonas sp.]|uniref:hypothetical protein n=1 Tax=Sphingomonas sp. TaxID=28214 RepID=UPI002CE40DEB|nr:hypothetical protein [Sphingomonas sp.]HWK35528.1 hypothetical protein [Sphingomonas sp.]
MAMTRVERIAIVLAMVVAVAMPVGLLRPPARPVAAEPPPPPLTVRAGPPLTAVFTRPLFAAGASEDAAPLPADAPQLIGVVGRIGSDAVAMVRGTDGSSRTLAVGEGVDGWTLESLAIDAAFFTRGGQRLRVPLPAGDQ